MPKIHYRYQLVQKKLLAIDGEQELKISVLDAMQWLKIAWDEVTSTTIQNCSHQVGFKTDSTPRALHEHDSSPNLAGALDDLRTSGVLVEGQVDDFTNIDKDLETAGTLTDEDIVASVCGTVVEEEDDADVDEQDHPLICPTNSDYRNAMDIIRRFVTCTSDN